MALHVRSRNSADARVSAEIGMTLAGLGRIASFFFFSMRHEPGDLPRSEEPQRNSLLVGSLLRHFCFPGLSYCYFTQTSNLLCEYARCSSVGGDFLLWQLLWELKWHSHFSNDWC